jgi:hypothetical protein
MIGNKNWCTDENKFACFKDGTRSPVKNIIFRTLYDARLMGWIKWMGKTLEFVGKLAQADSFERWEESQGEKIVTEIGLSSGARFFKDRKAKGIIWNELESLAKSSPELKAAVEDFVTHYPDMLDNLASKYTQLPHKDLDLCVVPRFLVNRDAMIEVRKRLGKSEQLANLKGGASFREYFFGELVEQLDEAYTKQAGKAAPDRPLDLGDKWVVGFNPRYEWKGGAVHYFVYSSYLRSAKDAKKEYKKQGKKEAAETLTACLKWLGELSSNERQQLEAKFP